MRERLSGLSHYRDLFSHEYHAFTEKEVLEALGMLDSVRYLAGRVKGRVKA